MDSGAAERQNSYLQKLFTIILEDPIMHERLQTMESLIGQISSGEEPSRTLDSLHYLILDVLGSTPSDWDLKYSSNPGHRSPLPYNLYLDDIRSPFNIGAIFRTADCFGINHVYLSPACPSPEHPRAVRTAMGCTKTVPWSVVSEPHNLPEPLFALETGGTDIGSFYFPKKGTLAIGSEELGISSATRKLCIASAGIVTIPAGGSKGSLNVSVAAGIALHYLHDNCM